MAILFDALLQTARALEALHESVATGGSTTTIVDSRLTALGWANDDFDQGTALWIRDANGAGGSQSRVASDFVGSSGTITLESAVSTAIESGDNYGVMTKRYPRGLLVGKINEALQELGEIESSTDIASTGALEYALSSAFKRISRIIAGDTTTTPQAWTRIPAYQHAEGRLLFKTAVPSGHTIRIYYYANHAALYADADAVNADLNVDWLGLAAAVKCARWRLDKPGADQRSQTALLNDLMAREGGIRARRLRWRPNSISNIFSVGYPEV